MEIACLCATHNGISVHGIADLDQIKQLDGVVSLKVKQVLLCKKSSGGIS